MDPSIHPYTDASIHPYIHPSIHASMHTHSITQWHIVFSCRYFFLTYMCAQNCGNERKVRNTQTAECTSVSLNKSIILLWIYSQNAFSIIFTVAMWKNWLRRLKMCHCYILPEKETAWLLTCFHIFMATTHNYGIILSLVHLPSEVKATILPRTQVSSRFGRTECHSFKFIRWVVVGARFESPRHGSSPQDIPVNKKKEKRRFTMLGQTSSNLIILMSRVLNQIILIIFCLQKWLIWRCVQLVSTPLQTLQSFFFTPHNNFLGNKMKK